MLAFRNISQYETLSTHRGLPDCCLFIKPVDARRVQPVYQAQTRWRGAKGVASAASPLREAGLTGDTLRHGQFPRKHSRTQLGAASQPKNADSVASSPL